MTNKIKVEDLKCFEEVSKVIGAGNARKELFKVINNLRHLQGCSEGGTYNLDTLMNDVLVDAFGWTYSPQGWEFWDHIDEGDNPYV